MPQQTVLQVSLRRCRQEEGIVAERVHQQEPQKQRNKELCQPQEKSSRRSFVHRMHAWEWDCVGGTLLASTQEAQDTFCCPSKPALRHCTQRVQLQQQQQSRDSLFHAGVPYPLDCCSGSSTAVRSPRTSTAAQSDYHSSKPSTPPESHTSFSFHHDYYTEFEPVSCGAAASLASGIPAVACTAPAVACTAPAAACTAPAVAVAGSAATSSPGAAANWGGVWNAPAVHEGKRCLPPQWHAAFPETLSDPRGDHKAVPRLLGSRSAGVTAETSPAAQTATAAAHERTSRASNAHAGAAAAGRQVRLTPAARQSSSHSAPMEGGEFYSCPSTFPLQSDSPHYTTAADTSADTLPAAHAAPAPSRASDSMSSASASSRFSSPAVASTSAAAASAARAAAALAAGASAAASARLPFWREATADPGGLLACHRGAKSTATARSSIDTLCLSGEGTPPAHWLSSSVRRLSPSASSQGGSGSSSTFCAGITQKHRSRSSTTSSSSSLPYSSSFPGTAAPAVCGPSRGGEREGRHDVSDVVSPAGCTYTRSDDVDFNTVRSTCASTFSRKTSSNPSSLCTRESNSLFNFASTAAASSVLYPTQSAGPSLSSRSSSGCPSTICAQQHFRPFQATGGLSPAAAARRPAGAAARVCAGGAARLSAGAASLHDARLCSPLAADASSAAGQDPAAAAASRERLAAATGPLFPAAAVDITSASPWPAAAASYQEPTASARRAAGGLSFLPEMEVLPVADRTAEQQGIRPGLSYTRQPSPRRSYPHHERRRDFQRQPRHSALSHTHISEEINSMKTSSSCSSSSSSIMGVHSSTNKSAAAAARSRCLIASGSHSRLSAHGAASSHRKDLCDGVSPEEVLRERRYISAAAAPSLQGKKLHPRDACMQRTKRSETSSRGSVESIRLEGEFQPAAGERLRPGTCCSYGVGKRLSSRTTVSQKLHAPASLQKEKSHHSGPPWSLHYSPKMLEESAARTGSLDAAGGAALFPYNRRAAAATTCPLQAFQAAAAAVSPLSTRTLHIDSAEYTYKQVTAAAASHVCRQSAVDVSDAELPAGCGKSEETRTARCLGLEKAGDACKSLYREKRGGRRSCFKESLSATQGIYTEHIHAEESAFLERMRARSSHVEIQEFVGQNRQQQQQLPLFSCVDQSAAAESDAFAAEGRFIFPETLREGCPMLLSSNCHTQQQQQCPPVGDLPPASGAAAAGLLQQQCSFGAPTRRTDRQRSHVDSSLLSVVSSLSIVSSSASKTAAPTLPEPAAAVAAPPDTVFSANAAAAAVPAFPPPAAAGSPRLPACADTHAAVPPAAAIQTAATQAAATKSAATQVAASQSVANQAAVPSVGSSFASERASVRCCLPPSLRRQFRVLQQVGRGMYGDVFVCALRRPAAAAAVAAPKQQQQGAQLSQQQHRQHMQQFCPPQPSSAAAYHHQQRGQQQSDRQQEQQQLPFHRLQHEQHREREMEDIEMHSAVRSVSTAGCPSLPSSKFHAPCRSSPEQRTPSTAAAAAHTAVAADLVRGCMQRTPSAEAATTECTDVWGEGAGGEQQLEYPEEAEREQQEETPEEEEERDSCEDGRRQLYAMKRVRLPTSKLKALFGMEQQVLREVTLLRTLKHVNILRLHAFQFELERWERRTHVPRGQQPGTSLLQQQQRPHGYEKDEAKQQQVLDKKENAVTLTTTHQKSGALTSSAHRAPAAAHLPSAAAAASPRQQTNASQAHVRIEQRYRPTFYLFFELCECDLAQVVDSTYEKFLDFWRTHVKEAAAAQAVSPTDIIQHLLQTSAHTIPRPGLDEEEVQLIAYQLFQAIAYCHSRDVMHRDIKPQNIMLLLDKEAGGKPHWVVKLGDFGLACHAYMRDACRTQEVVTLLYRPPELLMGCTDYTTAVDVWSTGIVVENRIFLCLSDGGHTCAAEMILGRPPFRGQASEADLLSRIQQWLGSPTPAELERLSVQPAALAEILKKREPVLPASVTREDRLRLLLTDQFNRTLLSDLGIHFLASVLQTDPEERPSAVEMLQHPWLRSALEKFGNGEVYLRPSVTTLPPDFLAVDPINFSFYFNPAQLTDSSDNGRELHIHVLLVDDIERVRRRI